MVKLFKIARIIFQGVKYLLVKIKTILIMIIVILTTIIIGWNFGFAALNPEGEPNNGTNIRTIPRSNGYLNWSEIEALSEPIPGQNLNINESTRPRIAMENNKISVVWVDGNNTDGAGFDRDIFYRYFDGSSWSKIQVISEPVIGENYNSEASNAPAIVVEDSKIYVVWFDENNTHGAGKDKDVFYRCNLTGSGWEHIQVISEPIPGMNVNTGDSQAPKIAVEDGNIHVIWQDNNDTNGAGGDLDLFYLSNLSGSGWGEIFVISEPIQGNDFNIGDSVSPDIAVENGKVHTVWVDNNDTYGTGIDADIFYRSNLGSSWEAIQVISEPIEGFNTNVGWSIDPSIAVENDKIYVVWQDYNITNGCGGNPEIFYKCNLTGYDWDPVQVISEPVVGKNFNWGSKSRSDIAVENEKIYVVWTDNNNTYNASTDWDIFYRSNLTGSTWEDMEVISEPVVGFGFNLMTSSDPEIAVSSNGKYIVWSDWNNTQGAGSAETDIFIRFTLLPLALDIPKVTPTFGNTSTYFNYTVEYTHQKNKPPTEIAINISGTDNSLLEVDPADNNYQDGKSYYYNTRLNISSDHTFQIHVTDGIYIISSALFNKPDVYNTRPGIITVDNLTTLEDIYYEMPYEYEDIDIANINQFGHWHFSTNASWLAFDFNTAVLNGTPTNDEVGEYWVNLTINDTIEIDFTNFTLTVIDVNDDPAINTTNVEITYEDIIYFVDYNATDIDSPPDAQIWSLNTNASSWLSIESDTGVLSGIPTNDEVGVYWVNISVNDTESGLDHTNFSLIVLNVNDPPEILTEDEINADVEVLYHVDYNATDIDSPLSQLIWTLDTNATWLTINSNTGIFTGTPTLTDVGWYNVNISVSDGDGGQAWHEFILTVIPKEAANKPPNITTIDVGTTKVNELYQVDYDATDDRTPVDLLSWALETNASWLKIENKTGVLWGTATLNDVGWCWVNVSVIDSENAWDYHNFTLHVMTVPIMTFPPELSNPNLTPSEGDTETEFRFSIVYSHRDDELPDSIQVIIDESPHDLEYNASSDSYQYITNLTEGVHTYYFTTTLGKFTVSTENYTTPNIQKPDVRKTTHDDESWDWLVWIIIIIIIVALILLFLYLRKKQPPQEDIDTYEEE